jgi:hypothetical protein
VLGELSQRLRVWVPETFLDLMILKASSTSSSTLPPCMEDRADRSKGGVEFPVDVCDRSQVITMVRALKTMKHES